MIQLAVKKTMGFKVMADSILSSSQEQISMSVVLSNDNQLSFYDVSAIFDKKGRFAVQENECHRLRTNTSVVSLIITHNRHLSFCLLTRPAV